MTQRGQFRMAFDIRSEALSDPHRTALGSRADLRLNRDLVEVDGQAAVVAPPTPALHHASTERLDAGASCGPKQRAPRSGRADQRFDPWSAPLLSSRCCLTVLPSIDSEYDDGRDSHPVVKVSDLNSQGDPHRAALGGRAHFCLHSKGDGRLAGASAEAGGAQRSRPRRFRNGLS